MKPSYFIKTSKQLNFEGILPVKEGEGSDVKDLGVVAGPPPQLRKPVEEKFWSWSSVPGGQGEKGKVSGTYRLRRQAQPKGQWYLCLSSVKVISKSRVLQIQSD